MTTHPHMRSSCTVIGTKQILQLATQGATPLPLGFCVACRHLLPKCQQQIVSTHLCQRHLPETLHRDPLAKRHALRHRHRLDHVVRLAAGAQHLRPEG